MQAYLKNLNEGTINSKPITKESTKKYTPLVAQITKLMQSLPPNMRQRDWTMNDLLGQLEGKFRSKPSAMKVAKTLRQLGCVRYRDHSFKGRGSRFWRHP